MNYKKIKEREQVIVKWPTAKLAKEKGFEDRVGHWAGKNYYNYEGKLNGDSTKELAHFMGLRRKGLSDEEASADNPFENIAAPTQDLLQTWLREEKGLVVYVDPCVVQTGSTRGIRYTWTICNLKGDTIGEDLTPFGYLNWSEALEKGLISGLKEI